MVGYTRSDIRNSFFFQKQIGLFRERFRVTKAFVFVDEITKDHRPYLNRKVDVPNIWCKGNTDKGHTSCMVYTNNPSHNFDTMRNVHAMRLWIAHLTTGAAIDPEAPDLEYYNTIKLTG